MQTSEIREAILTLVRPTGTVGLRPAGVVAQMRVAASRVKPGEVKESIMWLIQKGYLEKFSPAIAPAESRVRITAAGIDYLQSLEDF